MSFCIEIKNIIDWLFIVSREIEIERKRYRHRVKDMSSLSGFLLH